MDWIQVLVLAILQGLTEFLPVSSSAHLILLPSLTDWPDQGQAFDVAVHVGTLIAVVSYFRKEIVTITHDWGCSLRQGKTVGDSKLMWAVLFGTIPVGLVGLLLGDIIEEHLRSTFVIAVMTIVFGVLLGYSDKVASHRRDEHSLSWKDIIIIGCAQAIALIPGTSRSGVTITAALFLGLNREAAARYSFLLSIPVIILAGGLKTLHLIASSDPVNWVHIFWGAALSGIFAYLSIHYFLKLLEKIGMMPFVIYRLLLGGLLLAI